MHRIKQEPTAFLAAKEIRTTESRQIAAVQIACHIDLSIALNSDAETRARIVVQLARKIERERLRGASGHWSYDINRHIALKQAMEQLKARDEPGKYFAAKKKFHSIQKRSKKENGAKGAALNVITRRQTALILNAFSGRDPSSWQVVSAPQRNSEPPSDSSGRGPISRDTGQASAHNASSSAV